MRTLRHNLGLPDLRQRILVASLCATLGLYTQANQAQAQAQAQANLAPPETPHLRDVPYEQFSLSNGMDVILQPDSSQPLVAINIWYHVGPVNEPVGRSGFAHLFEHLMFEGSKYVGPNFDHWLEGAGATNSNGTTSWDRTNYFETVPREHLNLVLWLESDRMGYLRDTITQERLDVQRDVVKNERRQSYENAPYGPSALVLLDTLFPPGHPYHGAVIGSMADLSAATLDDVRDFAERYYAPSNATLCLAGNFEPTLARAAIEKYFGPLRKVAKPTSKELTLPPSPKAVRIVIDEPVDVAKVTFGWVTPKAFSPSNAALVVLSHVLSSGKSSRLYKSLVVDKRIAVAADADVDGNALGTLFTVDAMASAGTSIETLEAAMTHELEVVAKHAPSALELRRAKVRIRLELTQDLERLNGPGGESGRAGILQRFNHYQKNPAAWKDWQHAIEQVTAEDITATAAQYLKPTARVTVVTRPNLQTSSPAKLP